MGMQEEMALLEYELDLIDSIMPTVSHHTPRNSAMDRRFASDIGYELTRLMGIIKSKIEDLKDKIDPEPKAVEWAIEQVKRDSDYPGKFVAQEYLRIKGIPLEDQ